MTTAPVLFQNMPPLTPEEYTALEASILEHGILSPVITDEAGVILDGHHRSKIASERNLSCPKQIVYGKTDTEKRTMALSLNLDRRHLNREQKRALVAESVKADPGLTDREHARRLGASPTTVGTVREALVQSGEVSNLDTRTDPRGYVQPASKPSAPANVNTDTGEVLGNDGLTDDERTAYADAYAAGPGRGLTDSGREAIAKVRDRKQERAEREASIVNDLRLYLRHIGTDKAITGMTDRAKQIVIEALEEAATNLKETL